MIGSRSRMAVRMNRKRFCNIFPQATRGRRTRSARHSLRALVLCCCAIGLVSSPAVAQEDADQEPCLGVEVDLTVISKYIWHGYGILDDHGAFQPTVTFDLFQTGFSITAWGSHALASGFDDLDEIDGTVSYETTLFEEQRYALDLLVTYIYYACPNTCARTANSQEAGIAVGLPNLLPIGPSTLVPSWYCGYFWSAHAGGPDKGWFNVFALSYDLPVPAVIPDQEKQAICFAFDLTYNDGALGSQPGLSHATLGVSTGFDWNGVTLTPSVYYQWSFEETVNHENEFWSGLSLTHSF